MDCGQIIELLARAEGWLSGEEVSRALGVTRAAVWKGITALREEGWVIDSAPRQGYRLSGPPPMLSGAYISGKLPAGSLFAGRVEARRLVDSTNTQLKAMAAQGAPEGTALLSEEQTGGRGTRGRSFLSPPGGLYLSILLRPRVPLSELFTLTGWAAVAVRRGIEDACGAWPDIKWMNDLYLGGGKLVGILTELSLLGESGEPDYVVVGVGVNVAQTAEGLRAAGLDGIAVSLATAGYEVERNALTVSILNAFEALYRDFPHKKADYLADYRVHCMTLGRRVSFEKNGAALTGIAEQVEEDFSLRIAGDDGRIHRVSSGTVRPL